VNLPLSKASIHQSNKDNLLKLTETKSGQSLHLSFDFLDQEQGGIIQVVHTGKSSKDIVVRGTIKGAGNPVLKNTSAISSIKMLFPLLKPLMRKDTRRLGYFMTATLIIASLSGVLIIFFWEYEKAFGWILSLTYGFLIIPTYIIFIKRKVPKSLQIFEEDFEIEVSTNKTNAADS